MRTLTFWNSVKSKASSLESIAALIRSNQNIFIHGAAATPTPLIEALTSRNDLENVKLYHLHTAGPAPFVDKDKEKQFR